LNRSRRLRGADSDTDLIYLLAGTRARRDALADATRDMLAHADLGAVAAALADRRLLPLIGTRAIDVAPDLCPPRFRAGVLAAWAAAGRRGEAIRAETRRLCDLLAARDIRALPLKGPLLAADIHGDVGLRDTEDVDLLVPRERLHDAAALLREDGYRWGTDPLRTGGLPDLHLRMTHPDRPAVELHWRVHWYEEDYSAEVLDRAAPGDDGMLRAAPEDLGTCLLLFYARDGFHGARAAADVAAWSDRHAAATGFLEPVVRRHAALGPALTAAALAAEYVTGAPATAWLGSASVRTRRTLLAARLADWRQTGDLDQMAANISLVDGLLAPEGRGRAAAERQLSPDGGVAPAHVSKMLARYAAALWRLRRGRRWAAGLP
jgi:hypothetical protein